MTLPATFTILESADLQWAWLGQVPYQQALAFQLELVAQRKVNEIPDTLLMLEHPPVYTLGRSASENDILLNESERAAQHVTVEFADRGGQVTYHGPGQLVGYMIMDLRPRHLSVPRFVWLIEEGIRQWVAGFGIELERICGKPGLWLGTEKLASLGFHVVRGITYHGFSINLNTNLELFEGIVACGEKSQATSLQKILQRPIDLETNAAGLARVYEQIFRRDQR